MMIPLKRNRLLTLPPPNLLKSSDNKNVLMDNRALDNLFINQYREKGAE
jgi:hypothetical protein